MSEGWKCPNCGGAHAPWMQTCDKEDFVTLPYAGTPCDHQWITDTAGTRCAICGKREQRFPVVYMSN